MMNRRSFLSRSILSAASMGVGSVLPFGKGDRFGIRSADAAGLPTPYPVLLIMIGGGLDPAMHMVARANGSVGSATIVNRLPDSSTFKRTKSGIDYVGSVVTPPGKADFEPHLEDVSLIRAVNLGRARGIVAHTLQGAMWFGDPVASGVSRFRRLPWPSLLAAQFRKRGVIVPRPCAVAYQTPPASTLVTDPYIDLAAYATATADPATRPDRILSIQAFFNSLSTAGLPAPARQIPGDALIETLDQAIPAATQPDYAQRFSDANGSARELLSVLSGGPAWPPDPKILAALGLTGANLNPGLTGDPPFEQMCALAFQALSRNLAHVIAFKYEGQRNCAGTGWDSHERNVARQTTHGNRMWSSLGKLITLMKKTPSLIPGGKSLFDTTNIWIQSEMGRSPNAQVRDKIGNKSVPPYLTDGTEHWSHGSATFLGGRFKRGRVIGNFTPDWTAIPLNPATGEEAGGIDLSFNHLIATVMKAAGGDPSEYSNAPPIDAVLDMAL